MSENRLDLKLETLVFKPDSEPHIHIDKELCTVCADKPCTFTCPAGLYVWEDGQIVHNCEGCLECGACRAVCTLQAIDWHYPRGGYGVQYRWG